ncbi:MAG TPA: DUF2723 domain-containing protein [Gemmatimonadaceae bacterium]|nr:DUF2723 domain-containing protein [Gemmatimonadaceae bacterium]
MSSLGKAFQKPSDATATTIVVSVLLLAVYAASLAPSVTLWDAGEFQAAAASLGIPHPPGTPLYILLANTWARVLGFIPFSVALNLLSAFCTAIACGLLGGLMTRWTGSRLTGIAGGITAGSMLAVWLNATETEVYAVSMLLAVLMVVAGERAGSRDSLGYRALLAYLIGLAIPIQISALVAAPPAIFLAAMTPGGTRPEPRHVLSLGGVLAIVIAVSSGSVGLAAVGMCALVVGMLWRRPDAIRRPLEPVALVLVAGVALTATMFMLVRAAHDPLINQGNPSTLGAMMDVVTRQQYPLPGIWPRRAPVWIQLLNLVQYADWQVASGLDSSVSASWWRTPWSVLGLVLLVSGARWHWRRDRRSAWGTVALLASATLGIVVVLNLSAGPSILDRILPPGALHEPRERDYFFALGFATAGLWIGAGAVRAAQRWLTARSGLVTPAALGIAALPVALNWSAATRRPDALIAPTFAEALLASVPPQSVLLLAGDNDTYTVWYRQAVLGERRDVVPITISLLGADWYREEQRRRYRLLDSTVATAWHGERPTLAALVAGARREGRPVTASMSVSPALRRELAPGWALGGLAYVATGDTVSRIDIIDSARTTAVANLIEARLGFTPRGRDPASAYVARLLRCPASILQLGSGTEGRGEIASLDSRCNFK